MKEYSTRLLDWYEKHKRDLPWRHTQDPYRIWVAEVILQQTQVRQGLDYYLRFIEAFPDIKSLAHSSIEDVLRLWQGLGYYNRAIHMKKTAGFLMDHYHGTFPDSYEDIIVLKGIGPYIAAAIVSFAYDKPYPVVDGNVKRVISRLFGIGHASNAGFEKEIRNKAGEILDPHQPGNHNQAIMEFGALQCIPARPKCSECIFKDECLAYIKQAVDQFPPKKRKTSVVVRHMHFFIFRSGKRVLIHQRSLDDIWPRLYDFPSVETRDQTEPGLIKKMMQEQYQLDLQNNNIALVSDIYIHKLSHQTIHARFYLVDYIPRILMDRPEMHIISKNEFKNFGFPRLISHFLESYVNHDDSFVNGLKNV